LVFAARGVSALVQLLVLWLARRFDSAAAFGFRRLILFGSSQSTLAARQAAAATSQQQHNKALHPTAYSFGFPLVPRSKPTLSAAGELSR